MILLIQTIGQRDVQLYVSGRNYNYDSFNKTSLNEVQSELSCALKKKELNWNPMFGKEGEQEQTLKDFIESDKCLTFPLTEAMLQSLSNEEEYKLVLLTTDRSHISKENLSIHLKGFLEKEPYLYSSIIKSFIDEMMNHYEKYINDISVINLCKDCNARNADITDEFAYRQIDSFMQDILKQDNGNISSVQVFSSGGMPRISNALDTAINAYFPNRNCLMEQSKGRIRISRKKDIQNKYTLKFALLQRVKDYDFLGAISIANELKLKRLDIHAFRLLEIAVSWLYRDKKETEKLIDVYKKEHKNSNLITRLITMNEMLDSKNAVGCNLLRSIQESRKGNWWGMSTTLISTGELLIMDKIKTIGSKSVVFIQADRNKPKKFFFDLRHIPFKVELPYFLKVTVTNDRKTADEQTYYKTNWISYNMIISQGIKEGVNFDSIMSIMDKIKRLSLERNDFIHQGKPINLGTIEECLGINLNHGTNKIEEQSSTIKLIISEIESMKHITFINWLPILKEVLIDRILKLSPFPKQ